MSNFKDFVETYKKNAISTSSSSQELAVKIADSLSSVNLNISNFDRVKFGNEVVALANSDEVLNEWSQSIGDPKETESEDEFVDRAKSTLASILKRKLLR